MMYKFNLSVAMVWLMVMGRFQRSEGVKYEHLLVTAVAGGSTGTYVVSSPCTGSHFICSILP
jgi:hypothetical protein